MLPVRFFFSAPGGMQIKGTFDTPHCRSKGIYDTLDKLFFSAMCHKHILWIVLVIRLF